MTLSIIILTWNSINNIKICLNSIEQYYKYPIYVVDNASTDGTVDYIKLNHPQVKLIPSPSNLGFAAGCNLGIAQALRDGCESILLLNDDAFIIEDFISPCLEVLKKDNEVGIVGPTIVEAYDHDIIQCSGGSILEWTASFPYLNAGEKYYPINELLDVGFVLGAALIIRTDVLDKIGMLDPDYFPAYVEEADLCHRNKLAGYKNVIDRSSRVAHVGGASAGNIDVKYRRIMKNRMLFALKHLTPIKLLFAINYITLSFIYKNIHKWFK